MRNIVAHMRPPSAGTIIGVIALVLAMGGTGYASLDKNPRKNHAKLYSPSEYRPGHSEAGYRGQLIGSLDCTSSSSQEGSEQFTLPLDLPDGAEITKVTFYYFDTEPNEQLKFEVGSHVPGVSDAIEEFPGATSSTASPPDSPDPDANPSTYVQSVDVTPTDPVVVDNATRSYFVAAAFSACGTFTADPEDRTFILSDAVRVHYRTK